MKAGRRDEAQGLLAEVADVKEQLKTLETKAREAEAAFNALMLEIPNVPDPSVPVGATPEDNVIAFEWGEKTAFTGPDGEAFEPLAHWELAEKHGLIDWERGAKVAGAGFPFYIGKGARLQRALISLFLDLAGEAGYTEMQAPLLVNEASGVGTGQIPDKEGQMYETENAEAIELDRARAFLRSAQEEIINRPNFDPLEANIEVYGKSFTFTEFEADVDATVRSAKRLYLIPTGEVPVTNFHRDEIFNAADLPVPLRRAHALLAPRGGLLRQRRARPQPPPPIRQGRVGPLLHARGFGRALGNAARGRRARRAGAGSALPPPAHVHRRHGLHAVEEVRPGSVERGPRHVAGSLIHLQLPGVSGAPRRHPLPPRGRRQAGVRAHAQRQRPGTPAHPRGGAGEQPERGRQHHASRASGAARGLRADRLRDKKRVRCPRSDARWARPQRVAPWHNPGLWRQRRSATPPEARASGARSPSRLESACRGREPRRARPAFPLQGACPHRPGTGPPRPPTCCAGGSRRSV